MINLSHVVWYKMACTKFGTDTNKATLVIVFLLLAFNGKLCTTISLYSLLVCHFWLSVFSCIILLVFLYAAFVNIVSTSLKQWLILEILNIIRHYISILQMFSKKIYKDKILNPDSNYFFCLARRNSCNDSLIWFSFKLFNNT